MDTSPVSCNSLGKYFCVNGKRLEEQYVRYLSDFLDWDQLEHAENWILYPQNISAALSIDETSLSQGELYTVVTSKKGRGQKGSLVAMIKGTDSEQVADVLKKIPLSKRNKVQEVTLDMAPSMQKIVSKCFPKATQVTDRFHVIQLASDAVQQIRIKHRWEAIDQENKEIELSKETGNTYVANRLENGDTLKQLLARSRYLLFKHENKWTPSQLIRSEILFNHYPDIEKAYNLYRELSGIYENTTDKSVALTKLARWYDKVEKAGFKAFNTIANTIKNNYTTILNYFINRSTNASAESFNAKIKAFRSQFRGVRNIP
ncbi:ISAon1 family transposase, partial [Roseimarinus sediminis]|uniref:ISAon1 family transposase n=1 Tax=Roseimarinus sediminis TaxID=1610899 RepID=UPI003D2349C4